MDATAARLLDPLTIPDDHLAASRRADRVARSGARLAVEPAEAPVGRVNTPAHVARWMAAEAVRALRETTGCSARDWTILEPAAGSGVIIAALAERLGTLDPIWAIDADARARELAQRRIGLLNGRASANQRLLVHPHSEEVMAQRPARMPVRSTEVGEMLHAGFGNANGVSSCSPGLVASATYPGNPEHAASQPQRGCDTTPSALRISRRRRTQGSPDESGQPWAEGRSPFRGKCHRAGGVEEHQRCPGAVTRKRIKPDQGDKLPIDAPQYLRLPNYGAWRSHYHVGDALLDDKLLPPRPIDLVIGNPPYLGVRHARRLPSFERWRGRFGATEDLYAYFMRRAMRIVRPGGCVMLLVPDTWLTLSSYEDLRREVLAGRLCFVLRFPPDTFDRHVFPCVFLWQRADPAAHRVRYLDARAPHSLERPREFAIAQAAYENAPGCIVFEPTATARKMARGLARAGWAMPKLRLPRATTSARVVPLCEIAAIGDVGIHSRNCRHRLFFAGRDRPHLERLLQGRQIEPYAVRWDSPKARYRWVDIHYAPDASVPGRRGDGSPSVRGEYWSWQGDPAIFQLPERILIRQTGDRIVAARLAQKRTHYYTDNTLFTAALTDAARAAGITYRYLLGYLNSAIASRMYRFLSGEIGRPQAQVKVGLLRRLPFVLPSPAEVKRVEGWVRGIERQAARENGNRRLQASINRHFAGLIDHATRCPH